MIKIGTMKLKIRNTFDKQVAYFQAQFFVPIAVNICVIFRNCDQCIITKNTDFRRSTATLFNFNVIVSTISEFLNK